MEDLDSTIWNRSKVRRTSRTSSRINWKKISLVLAHITIAFLSSYASATTPRPVLHQVKIGFAGQLREDGSQLQPQPHSSPNQLSNRGPAPASSNSSSYNTNSQTSSSNNLDITARAPLFRSRPGPGPADPFSFNSKRRVNRRILSAPSPSPSASSPAYDYHPNHRYPDQPVNFDNEKYYILKKQPTSSIIAETAYYSPARRLEVDDHDRRDGPYRHQLQYSPRPSPSPTPFYRKIYRESSSASAAPVLTSFYTKKPTFDDFIETNTPHPEPKKYAFAYAVGDKTRGDDYSHRESRDGKVTMGEYKVLLPDGRLQIVRYTADAKAGFKADVTYEGEKNPYDHAPTLPPPSPSHKPYIHPKAPFYVGPSGSPDLRKQYIDSGPSPTPSIFSKYHNSDSPYKSYPSISPSIVYKGTEGPQISKGYSQYKTSGGPNSITPTPFGFLKDNPSPSSPSSFPKNIYDKIASTKSPYPYSPIPRGFPAGPSSPKPPSGGARKLRKIVDAEPPKNYIPTITNPSGGKSRLIPIEHFKAGPYTDSPKEYPKIFRFKPTPSPVLPPYNSPTHSSNSLSPSHPPQEEQHYLLVHDHHHDDHHHHHPSPLPYNPQPGPSPHPYNPQPGPSPTPYEIHASPSPSPTPYEIHASPSPSFGPSQSPFESHRSPNSPFAFDPHRSTKNYPAHQSRNFISPTPYYSTEESDSKIPPVKSSLATFTSILGVTPKPVLYLKSKPPPIAVGRPVQPSIGGLVYLETPATGLRPNQLGVKDYLDRIPHEFDNHNLRTTEHPYRVGSKDYGDAVSYGIKTSKEFTPSREVQTDYLVPTQLNTDHFRAHHESAEHHLHNQQQFLHHHSAPEVKKVEHHHVVVSYPEQNHQQ